MLPGLKSVSKLFAPRLEIDPDVNNLIKVYITFGKIQLIKRGKDVKPISAKLDSQQCANAFSSSLFSTVYQSVRRFSCQNLTRKLLVISFRHKLILESTARGKDKKDI